MEKTNLIYPCGFEVFNENTRKKQEAEIDTLMKNGYMPIYIFNDNSDNIKNLVPIKFKKNIEKHPAYSLWITTLMRYYNKKDEEYPKYGGAGLVIRDSWLNSFEQFCKDMQITTSII